MRPVHLVADGRAAIPLTMIGGPTGAGKTAVIHNLLELTTNRRVTAVVASTPKVSWETTARPRDGGAGLVWDNGNTSIVTDDPTVALADILRGEQRPDHVIVEVQGRQGSPRRLAYTQMPGYRDDGWVLVVDACCAGEAAELDQFTSDLMPQLRAADLVILNKLDVAGDRSATLMQQTLSKAATGARFLWAERGRLASSLVLGPSQQTRLGDDTTVFGEWRSDFVPSRRFGRRSLIGESCCSWCLVTNQGLKVDQFREWVSHLPSTIVRAAGTVYRADLPHHRYDFRLMGPRWSLTRGAPWNADQPATRIDLVAADGPAPARTLQ